MTRPRAAAILAAIALVPVLPFAFGYGRQDFLFHVESWVSTADVWRTGQFLPVWAPAASFNLGDPHLGLYPPISFFIGALLTLILPIRIAPAAFVWLAVLGCGLSMYHASRFFLAQQDRLPAAILYMLSPYVVTNATVRFAAAELLLQSFLPFILLAAYRLCAGKKSTLDPAVSPAQSNPVVASEIHPDFSPGSKPPRNPGFSPRDMLSGPKRQLPILAALLALAWLTNFPGSIVLLYGLAILAAIAAIQQRTITPFLRIAAAEALALALTAFRLLPTWAEHTWIKEAVLYKRDPRMGLLFMPLPPFPDNVLMILFWIFLCAQTLLILAALYRRTQPLNQDPPARTWLWLAAVAIFFQIPLAYPIWPLLPELRVVQFPFRFLLFLAPVLPLLLLAPTTRTSLRKHLYAATVALNVLPLLLFLAMQYAVRDTHVANLAADWHTQGYESAPEYTPANATAPTRPANRPPLATPNPDCTFTLVHASALTRTFTTDSDAICTIRLPVFFYPYWSARGETGQPIPTTADPTGLLLIPTPPGSHTVTVTFHAASPTRTAGLWISLIALLILAALFPSRVRASP